MENTQTAIDWLVKELSAILGPLETKPMQDLLMVDAINKAKQMEKQQIMKAVYDSMGTNFDPNMGRAELYYNETFK